jgi:hypothetical protein
VARIERLLEIGEGLDECAGVSSLYGSKIQSYERTAVVENIH